MATDDQGDLGTGQGLKERARQNAEANAYVTQRDHPSTPTEPKSSPYASTPQDKVTNQRPAPKGEKAMYKKAMDWTKSLKIYDDGGKVNVQKTDVNDGNHEIAILKHGERVLTPEQNTDWEHAKSLGGVSGNAPTKLPIGGKDTRDANDVTPDMTPKKIYDKGGRVSVDCYDGGGVVGEHTAAEKSHFHRAMSHLHTGALHRHFNIPEGKPIPMAKKQEAANSDSPHVAAMGRLALAMHGWKGQKGSNK